MRTTCYYVLFPPFAVLTAGSVAWLTISVPRKKYVASRLGDRDPSVGCTVTVT